jgi:membrane protein DedA with SNARE-associated domain
MGFQEIISLYLEHVNYFTVFIFMAIESSFIPFPSEIVIPPAAFKAANGELNIYLVILSGSLGALAGAFFNYYIALSLGRKLIYKFANTKFAHLLMISEDSIVKSEQYFLKYGNLSTLIGRLVPAVRQLISLPAGLAKMNIGSFVLFTVIGSTLWNCILAALGYFLYEKQDLLKKYYSEISYGFLIVGVLFVLFLIYKSFKKKSPINNEDGRNLEE